MRRIDQELAFERLPVAFARPSTPVVGHGFKEGREVGEAGRVMLLDAVHSKQRVDAQLGNNPTTTPI